MTVLKRKTGLSLLLGLAGAGGALALVLGPRPPAPRKTAPPASLDSQAAQAVTRLSTGAFVENRGQWDSPARYVARIGPLTAFLEDQGWTFTLEKKTKDDSSRGVAVRMRFEGSAGPPRLEGEAKLPGYNNYFLGNDPARWRTRVPRFASVRYLGMYPGVDVRVREESRRLEYDLVLEPGADLSGVEVRVEGAKALRLDEKGTLVMETALGAIEQRPPATWEITPAGGKRKIPCRYVLLGPDRFGFAAPEWNGDLALVVDPKLVWSTFLGGKDEDKAFTWATGKNGLLTTVAGYTKSTNFPTTTGAYQTTKGKGQDAFVTRLDPLGKRLLWSTFLGGNADEWASSLAVDPTGAMATIAGRTKSPNFPTTPGAYDTTHNGGYDGFVTRLDPSGTKLVWSTFLGGKGDDSVGSMAVDPSGMRPTLTGQTSSTGFPTPPGAYDTTFNGGKDAFVTRLHPSGAKLLWSTFLGGGGSEEAGHCIAVDGTNQVVVGGRTNSSNFPTTKGAFDTTYNSGLCDAFVTRLDAAGAKLLGSTFLGGNQDEHTWNLALDPKGEIVGMGFTKSGNFPTTKSAFDRTKGSDWDVFIFRLDPSCTKLLASTFLGGNWHDYGRGALTVDATGAILAVAFTGGRGFPTTPGAYDRTYNGGNADLFVTRLDPMCTRLLYSTFLGGNNNDETIGCGSPWIFTGGKVLIGGFTNSTNFPVTAGAYDTTHNGNYDAFVAKLTVVPPGVKRYGASTPACKGPETIYVLEEPKAGEAKFGFAANNAPPSSAGVLLIGVKDLPAGLPICGITLWVDVTKPFFAALVSSDTKGESSITLPMPTGIQGAKFFTQYVWVNTASCGGAGTLSATDALEITVQ